MPLVAFARAHYDENGFTKGWTEGVLGYGMTEEEIAAKLKEILDERIEMRARREAYLAAQANKQPEGWSVYHQVS